MRLGTDQDDDLPEADELPEVTDAMRAELDEPLTRPLAAFTTDEIFAEIAMRYPTFVFVAEEVSHDWGGHKWVRRSEGSFSTRVGMAQRLLWFYQNQEFGE
jgi:hypothetical protein